MRKEHRPYSVKKVHRRFQDLYAKHFTLPHFDSLGDGFTFMKPWHVKIFGPRIRMGNWVTIIAEPDKKVRLSVWSENGTKGSITIGNYSMICPGVRIGSADEIRIGDGCMFADGVYVSDADWHGIYNRIAIGKTSPVSIEDNVWIGDSVIVCKGVTIGQNSIIGAGSVVAKSIPSNCIAAGNPAKIIKRLNPEQEIIKRARLFSNPENLFQEFDKFDRTFLKNNSLFHWLRTVLVPSKKD